MGEAKKGHKGKVDAVFGSRHFGLMAFRFASYVTDGKCLYRGAYASICQSARVWVCVSKLMPVFTTGRPLRAKREG